MKYVVGLAFNPAHTMLLMQLKVKGPDYARGWLNGPGGKVEQYPTPENLKYESHVQAMVREFREETGIDSTKDDWLQFHRERHPSGTDLTFYTTDKLDIRSAVSTTVEPNVLVELGWNRSREFVFPSGYLWSPSSDGVSSTYEEHRERIDIQVKKRGGMIYNMPYLIPMALTYLEHPEHRYLEG